MLYLYVLLIPVLVVFSWIASVWDDRIVNLLSADGLGWLVTSTMHNISQAPLGILAFAMIALSSVTESGILSNSPSLKRRRSLMVSVFITTVVMAIALISLCIPGNPLYSPFGSFVSSPLYYVLPAMFLLTVVVCGTTYGYMMGRATNINEMLQMHLFHIRKHAVLFPLFMVSAEINEIIDFSQIRFYLSHFLTTFLLFLLPIIHEMLIKREFFKKKCYKKFAE